MDVPWSPYDIDGRSYDWLGLAAAADLFFVMVYDTQSQVRMEEVLHAVQAHVVSQDKGGHRGRAQRAGTEGGHTPAAYGPRSPTCDCRASAAAGRGTLPV